MSKIYEVSYDLKKPGQDYEELIKELKRSSDWWHYLKSTWLIYTNETAEQIYQRIGKFIDKNDYILIINVGKDYHGWLPNDAWDWIKKYL